MKFYDKNYYSLFAMQLYALDSDQEFVHARRAFKQINYFCLECGQILRLRGGPQRKPHFYHYEPDIFCRHHQKGEIHLNIQSYLYDQLPAGDCQLERPFPSIGRIADVAWLSEQIVFEIQFSPISYEEVLARNHSYEQAGWKTVWILHDRRFNQARLSGAEMALDSSPHFFCNMDERGEGVIYDQFDIREQGFRKARMAPLPLLWERGIRKFSDFNPPEPLDLLKKREANWKGISFEGDLLNLFRESPQSAYIQQALLLEKEFGSSSQPFSITRFFKNFWKKGIIEPINILFHVFLERMCR